MVPVFRKAVEFPERTAVLDHRKSLTYASLFMNARDLANRLLMKYSPEIGDRVVFLAPNDASYVVTQWATWMAGCIGE